MNQFKPFSALILSGLKAHQAICAEAAANPKVKGTCTEITMYRCDTCDELHDDEDEAQDCRAEEDESSDRESDDCPVCGAESYDYRAATDCCLWKDLDAPKRWAIADAVEAGATWQEAIRQHTGQSIN
jgi:hypothetical protein